jgi:hypothetical protein
MAMKNVFRGITIGFASLFLVFSFPHDSLARMFKFSGGPSGGTFQYYASAISTLAKTVPRVVPSKIFGSPTPERPTFRSPIRGMSLLPETAR